jgi:peptide deformylase
MIRPICRMGNPILRKVTNNLERDEILSDDFDQLLTDLQDSMKHYGGIGIAAPQIGVDLKVAIVELPEENRYGQKVNLPFTVFINPIMTYLTDEKQGFWEGCLSLPGLRGYVERPSKVQVNYLDEKGNEKVILADGFLATVLQHELDHLEGVLYIDRITDKKLISYQEEYNEFIFSKNLAD